MMHGTTDMVKRGRAFGLAPFRRAGRQQGALLLLVPALLWVFTQLAMSGLALLPTQAMAGGLRVITICTGSELTTITVGADGQPASDTPAKAVKCPWCAQFGGIGELPPPDPAPVSLSCGNTRKLALPPEQARAATAPFFNYSSRAPPLAASL